MGATTASRKNGVPHAAMRPPARARPPQRAAWPQLVGCDVSDVDQAFALAESVRRVALGEHAVEAPLRDLALVLRPGRVHLSIEQLSAAVGGMQAFIAPDRRDRFEVVVDPEPPGGWRPRHERLRNAISRHRLRFLVGHELAHSFFFARVPGREPVRRVPDSPQQERFCDAFATALLLPRSVVARTPPEWRSVLAVQRAYDVSLELTVRVFADIHGDRLFALLYFADNEPRLRPQWMTPDAPWRPRWWSAQPFRRCRAGRDRMSSCACGPAGGYGSRRPGSPGVARRS
jgi:hypothetical protein